MADEELNEGQAQAAMQQLMYAWQFMGKMSGVMNHYERMTKEIPDLEKRKADLDHEVSQAQESLANMQTHHSQCLKEMDAEYAARKDALTQEHAQEASKLSSAIDDLKDRKTMASSAAARAEQEADERVSAASARVKEAEEKAKAELAYIDGTIAAKRSEYEELVAKLNSLKASIGQVPAE